MLVVIFTLAFPVGRAVPILTDPMDESPLWTYGGQAVVDCTRWSPDCELKLAPVKASHNEPPAYASAERVFPGPGTPAGFVSWTFFADRINGVSDADLYLAFVDGTIVLVHHTETPNFGNDYSNNGVTVFMGAQRLVNFAQWPANESQRFTFIMPIDDSSAYLAIGPADGSRPSVRSEPIVLPATAVALSSMRIVSTGFDKVVSGSYWFDDVEVGSPS